MVELSAPNVLPFPPAEHFLNFFFKSFLPTHRLGNKRGKGLYHRGGDWIAQTTLQYFKIHCHCNYPWEVLSWTCWSGTKTRRRVTRGFGPCWQSGAEFSISRAAFDHLWSKDPVWGKQGLEEVWREGEKLFHSEELTARLLGRHFFIHHHCTKL